MDLLHACMDRHKVDVALFKYSTDSVSVTTSSDSCREEYEDSESDLPTNQPTSSNVSTIVAHASRQVCIRHVSTLTMFSNINNKLYWHGKRELWVLGNYRLWSVMTLNHRMTVERYPNFKEEVGGSIPGCGISSLLDKNLAMPCLHYVSKKEKKL